ncbi:uncharacterized protein KY384_000679 [Bacidia gigantensis]|uniref:uncharacterized protein n=1 Tax=Bacidia gigantensis TaxID=2732470 RepID=UPI001D05BE25|nr:uncharacterized protein KY384_000679 [Bacidia gigantensis]KAG8525917.1 hypothetical protein KY384_000679 [Bacidia gigantensis]
MAQSLVQSGLLHSISRPNPQPLVAFEHFAHHAAQKSTIILLGGLGDGLLTIPYTSNLAARLPNHWRIVEPILGSAYRQWGFSTLGEDVEEIVLLVQYFRSNGGKVVLMGHSTGCQMIMHYLSSPLRRGDGERPRIDGALLQGSVSDREGMVMMLDDEDYEHACHLAQELVDDGKADEMLPIEMTKFFTIGPLSAKRFLSLASPPPNFAGEDDYFSSDLSDGRLERTFGAVGRSKVRFAFLFGDRDQHVPKSVDKKAMVQKWERFIKAAGGTVDEASGILEGGTHTLKEAGAPLDSMVKKIRGFVSRLEV